MNRLRVALALLIAFTTAADVEGGPFRARRARLRQDANQRRSRAAQEARDIAAYQAGQAKAAEPVTVQASGIGGGGIDTGGGASTSLGGYPVIITSPADEDALIYDDASGAWINGAGGGGGGGITVTGTEEGGRIPAYNPGTDDYRSTIDPHGVNVAQFNASLTNDQAFADVSSTTLTLETGYDSHWPDDANPESNCLGWTGLILGAGPSHSVAAPAGLKAATLGTTGSTARSYTIVSRSGALGCSAKATSVNVTDGVTANGTSNYTGLFWRHVADARGYAIYSEIYSGSPNDANKWHVADVPGCMTCWEVPCNATTSFQFADIGDTITQTGTGDTGTLVGYINDDGGAGRVWIVPNDAHATTGDTFDGTGVMTVNARTGTPSGAASNVAACYWEDHGERYYEGTVSNGGDDYANTWFNRAFRRMPTIGMARLVNGHTTLTSDTLLGILRIGQDEAQQLTQDNTAHWIRIRPLTPRDLCDASSGFEFTIPGKSVTGTLDGTVGMSIDPHQIGDTIIEPWSSSGRRYKCRRRTGWFMTGPDTTELQQFVVSGSPAGGTFTLTSSTYGTSSAISPGATAAQFTDALRAVPGFENVVGYINSGTTPNFTYRVAFIGVNGDTPQLTLNNSLTGGSSPTVTISTTTAGAGITMSTTLNATTQESSGDLQWRREEADVPVNPPPASAMRDAQPFIVTAASGTTLTIDTDLTTPGNQGVSANVDRTPGDLTSMAGLVLHNDLRAFKLAEDEATSRTNGTKTIVVPGGDPEIITAHGKDWDMDGTADYDAPAGVGDVGLFGMTASWRLGRNANVWFRPVTIPNKIEGGSSATDALGFFSSLGTYRWSFEGGTINLAEIAEPVNEHFEGYTYVSLANGSLTGITQVASRGRLANTEIWSFPSLWQATGMQGGVDQASFDHCMWDWGGGGHTAGVNTAEAIAADYCKAFGRDGGERNGSSVFYTDSNPPSPRFQFTNGLIYNSQYNIRLRSPHCWLTNSLIDESDNLEFEGVVYDVHLDGATFKNCGGIDSSVDGTIVSNVYLYNTPLSCSGGTQVWSNCISRRTADDGSAVPVVVSLAGGSVSLANWKSDNEYSDNTRGILVTGGTNHRISGFGLEQNSATELFTFRTTTAFKSDLWVSDSKFVANGGPSGQDVAGTVSRIHLDNVTFEDGTNTVGNEVAFGNQWVDATNCTFKVQVIVPTEATGTAQAGAAGTITLASGAESSVDNVYRGWQVYISSGTGSGQTRYITAYVASTRVASVSANWSVNPDNTSVYALMPPNNWRGNSFMSTTADTFAVRGAIFEDNDFNVHPTLSDVCYTNGNTIRGANIYTPAALSLGSQELTQRYVTDFVRLTQHGSNSTITGMAQMMGGTKKTFATVGASGTLTWDSDSGVDETTELLISGGDYSGDATNAVRSFGWDDVTLKWRNN